MSAAREGALVAQTKINTAERLLGEAARELFEVLPTGHPLHDEALTLHLESRRVALLLVQTLKRIP